MLVIEVINKFELDEFMFLKFNFLIFGRNFFFGYDFCLVEKE